MKRFSKNASLGELVFQPSCKDLASVSNVLLDSPFEILLTPFKNGNFHHFQVQMDGNFQVYCLELWHRQRERLNRLINHWGMERIWMIKIYIYISKSGYSSTLQIGSEFGLLRQWPPKCSHHQPVMLQCLTVKGQERAGSPSVRGQEGKKGTVKGQISVKWQQSP